MACGSALDLGVVAPAGRPTEERRIVSILFVDLVGFTERSDRADPEDVRRTLVPFHTSVQRDLERFGGTLDKFIGDAVMGVFGSPLAHEDDPERAVRAALAILDSVPELGRQVPDLAVRIAVNTGEAVVTFGSGPQVGEAVAGDVVNTASRMQGVAPRNGVVVGSLTHRATRDLFEFEEMGPVSVKGKSEPLQVWRVMGERAQGPVAASDVSFVGRDRELVMLRERFARTVDDGTAGLVTVVGEPGIGKSRLVEEFRQGLASDVVWRAGRCVPYGDDVTFRALADVVRAEAGILPSDGPASASAKLGELTAAIEASTFERDWLARRLQPLLAIGDDDDVEEGVPASESAAAWSRIVRARAERSPVVLLLEDLHWAEPVLREVVERSLDELAPYPVLFLCTARPELLELDDGWGNGSPEATTIRLAQLTDTETASLIDEALSRNALPEDTRIALIDRAGGNPLFALEFVRMIAEVASSDPQGGVEDIVVPQSVHAMVAARLDSIPGDLRALVQDAAVVGTAFWPAALAALSGRADQEVRSGIGELVRRGLVEPAAASWFPDHAEYGFAHALIREVAYARIPRLARARKHRAAGEWLEREAGDRAAEHAGSLANHFHLAVELATAAGAQEEVAAARDPAERWLLLAAEQASRIDQRGGFVLYERALGLLDRRTHNRARALVGAALMGRRTGELAAAEILARFEEARSIEEELGRPIDLADALTRLGNQLGAMGETTRSREALVLAVDVLEHQPPSRELARACAFMAQDHMFAGHVRESLAWAERALGLARGFDEDDVAIMALHIRGDARCSLGEPGGLADLEEALEIAESTGNADYSVTSENYLAEWKWALEGPRSGLAHDERALELAGRRGVVSQGLYTKAHALGLLFELGRWDQALRWGDELLATGGDRLDRTLAIVTDLIRARILLYRCRATEAADPEEMLELARPIEDLQALAPAFVVAAEFAVANGDPGRARSLLTEFEEATRDTAAEYRESYLACAARTCIAAGDPELAARLVELSRGLTRRDRINVDAARATVAEAGGQLDAAAAAYGAVAEEWAASEVPFERANALAGASRCLAALERREDATAARADADRGFDALGVGAEFRG